ncbi:tRNA sulfurtransferase [Fundidesulfovibrio magnetotacticus]|uniref:tRNA sulfurtransferase n=1 Tax=Fundidesulfovibrio magnetotacticus TaxID=2730080 RepID=A0A6V8M0H6_9BACT|nr:tRNA(5-methylaminomethyl-2-thiouridylate) methyltransferase [Fundidesulfovibrio magnetotacticus]GFK95958.1 tRNA sulfurtransferase [Fundidesulfovibrio magnetotacticus]
MPIYDALALFSGGLDSILAARTVAAQGLKVLCLHYVSPFFGHPDRLDRWREAYGLDIEPVDVGEAYVAMLRDGPAHGVGKGLNPCVDCKILMMSHARGLLERYGAKFLISGEVKGQRPMSQRRDALDVISRDARVRDLLLRPLCALTLKPTPMEESGLVDRERLHGFNGRGRGPQLALARALGVTAIPQPAGGCLLTERESAKRYLPVLAHHQAPTAADFELANLGRQFWSGSRWMAMGRKQADNAALGALARPGDILLDVEGFPSPLGLIRELPGHAWAPAELEDAAALLASYSPKAVTSGLDVVVLATRVGEAEPQAARLTVRPARESKTGLAEPDWEAQAEAKRGLYGESREDDH